MRIVKRRLIDRRFIRHPSRMPIRVELLGDLPQRDDRLRNVCEGGLCFVTALALDPDTPVRLTIPVLGESFEIEGIVVWCRGRDESFEVGVRFVRAQDRFSVRMVEQLCYIEDYRREVEREEGRRLGSEEAAAEWIELFADRFPGLR